MYQTDTIAAPAGDPITLAEAKIHIKCATTSEDDYITGLIKTAHRLIAKQRGIALMPTQYRLTGDTLPIKLGKYPLVSVETLKYRQGDGDFTTLTADTDYTVYPGIPGRIVYRRDFIWYSARADAFQVEFTAGYADAASVPDTYKHAMKLLVGHLYEQRQATTSPGLIEIPLGIKSLLDAEDACSWGG